MKTRLLAGVLGATFAASACVTEGGDDPNTPSCEGLKCDGVGEGGALDPAIPGEAAVVRIYQDAIRDRQIDADEAMLLGSFTKKFRSQNTRIAAFLAQILDGEVTLSGDARATLEAAISGERPDDVPLENEVYRIEFGGNGDFLFDDALYLLGDGRVAGDTGIVSHSRGYAAKRDGVLFRRHGSVAPHFDSTGSWSDTSVLREQGPDAALDKAAQVFGLPIDQWTSFSAIARDPNYYDPSSNTPYWAGICQGWTHNALDNRLSLLVDVPGPEGERGLWIFGQWVSRADLGNAIMGATYGLGIADSVTIDSFVKPNTLVQGLAQHVLRGGGGLRVDIWNDSHNSTGTYNPQIWNQPIVSGSVEVQSLSSQTAADIIAFAGADPQTSNAKLVVATATWGTEANDGWEGEPLYKESTWNMYMVTDQDGRVVKSYMAFDLVEAGVTGLPVTTSDGLPDYMAYPKHELTDASFEHGHHRLLVPSNGDGKRFRFLVGTVLARGIRNDTREAFESEVLAGGVDPVDIATRFPGIANAYSPEQWREVFEPVLGPGEDFGAVWNGFEAL